MESINEDAAQVEQSTKEQETVTWNKPGGTDAHRYTSSEATENYHGRNAFLSNVTSPDTTYAERSYTPVPLEFHQPRNSKDQQLATVLTHPRNEVQFSVPGLSTIPSLPYYVPGMMNEVMVPSSQLFQGSQHDVQKHAASTVLPQYNSHPHCSNHVPMMTSFPYYPIQVCMQTGQMPASQLWPSNGISCSAKVKPDRIGRREAALIKFRQKRKDRCFDKKIRYMNRKRLAERRPRVRGQFVRQMNGVDVDLNGQPINAGDSDEDNEEEEEELDYDDSRISFASAISTPPEEFRGFAESASSEDYNIWMAEPGSIKDRRQRLLQGMGLSHDKELLRVSSNEFKLVAPTKPPIPEDPKQESPSPPHLPSSSPIKLIPRSKSEGSMVSAFAETKCREETLIGADSKPRLLRLSSLPSSQSNRNMQLRTSTIKPSRAKSRPRSIEAMNGRTLSISSNGGGGGFLIKNLDTGNVFLINEDGTTSSLSDLQTGKQLTMEEFEKTVGHSPIVKELMRRENVARAPTDVIGESERKIMSASLSTKSFRASKKKGSGWLKNIKGVANSINGFIADREKDHTLMQQQPSTTSKWTKVHQHGKSHKEISGLYMCQEIQAHEGSIWCIKFSPDARYLASAGEDRIIHLWEVIDCDVFSARAIDETISTPLHPLANSSADRPPLADAPVFPSERKRRGKLSSASKKRGVPDFVTVPDTVFSLSDKPVCSFEGHLDDVLDLSWSKSQQLLSSSMDKTVRLWDMESKTCLKLFAHNDYVTCIQFNPMDDEYFISGSLDAKVRIWSIPDRKVVDWTDLHEMVTAVCYTPDGQGALVGSHRGSCRLYDTTDCKLNQKGQIDVQTKKKSQAKKITGFQFAPGNPSEVLITSADSRIRIFDGSDITYKFRGFRNTSSQISASFSTDGRYIVSASEDSQVYVWKRDEIQHTSGGKSKGLITTQSYERFQCRDVSVAIPWPGSTKYDPSMLSTQSKRHSKFTPSHSPAPSGTLQEGFLRSPSVTRSQEALVRSLSGTKDQETFSRRPSVNRVEEVFTRSPSVTRNLPPLPKKNNISDKPAICSEEEPLCVSRTNSGIGDSAAFVSAPASAASSFRECPSISASESSLSSLSWLFDGANNSVRNNIQPTAWGLVVVAAGLGGELRIYQNFGLPVRVGRQANLFASGSVGSTANKRFL
ncbi:hypothetical protein AQUCO_00200699v1 [Aquilegia coerulea]|uniref:CCT domain-containing protein n=1 Tax=Aquilegia coerulea TaxID=218851 RepID=A0A2G5F4C4_AQUCA|nr:hypothetical protein AQUCO_00200699v1 [Aquilegia coerulea]